MASPFSWPMSVPSALRAPAPVNQGVRPLSMNRRSALTAAAALLAPPWLSGCSSTRPTPASSEKAFRAYAAKREWRDGSVGASLLTSTVIGFYTDVVINGLAPDGGDQLLFQWGIFDWGSGPSFEFDITRQFIAAEGKIDATISQLRVTAHYQPTSTLAAIKQGNAWCKSKLEAESFERFIRGSPSFAAVQAVTPQKVAVVWGPV